MPLALACPECEPAHRMATDGIQSEKEFGRTIWNRALASDDK